VTNRKLAPGILLCLRRQEQYHVDAYASPARVSIFTRPSRLCSKTMCITDCEVANQAGLHPLPLAMQTNGHMYASACTLLH
jgi:hypothetical protein